MSGARRADARGEGRLLHELDGRAGRGEGFEYHLLAIGLLLPILIAGPGRLAIGRFLPLPKVARERPVAVLE